MATNIPDLSSYAADIPDRFDAFGNITCLQQWQLQKHSEGNKNNVWHHFRDCKIVLLLQSHYKTFIQALASVQKLNYMPARTMHKSTFQITMKAPHSWSWQENLFHSTCARQCFSSRWWCRAKCTKCYTHKLKRCTSFVGFIHATNTGFFLLSQLKLLKQTNASVILAVTGFLCIEHRIITDLATDLFSY